MKTELYKYVELLTDRSPVLDFVKNEITEAYCLLVESYKNGRNCWLQETVDSLWMQSNLMERMSDVH